MAQKLLKILPIFVVNLMLRKRVIALILLKGDLVIQAIGFKRYLPIGKLSIVLEYLELWDVDEVIILDIDASKNGKTINFGLIGEASKKIFVPLTVGGGLSSVQEIEKAIHNGADKVSINSAFFGNKMFIDEAIQNFGSQCIVLAADVKLRQDDYYVYLNNRQYENLKVSEWLKAAINIGAGEVFINSMDNDGKKNGYDLDLMKMIDNYSTVPVVAAGGVGCPKHVEQLFNQVDSAAAIGNILYHKEHSTSLIKAYLKASNQNVRASLFLNYENSEFNVDGALKPIEHSSIFLKDN